MQARQAVIKQYQSGTTVNFNELTTPLANWLTRVFGCWHRELSRPFTLDGESYRVCVDCGARRKFDPRRWEMVGDFYYSSNYLKTT